MIMQKISRVKSLRKEKRKARFSPIHGRAKECSDFSVFFIDLVFFFQVKKQWFLVKV